MWQPIGNLIPSSIKKAGISKQISDSMVCEEFDNIAKVILGDLASKCRAVYVKDRCLWIACLSSSVSNELKMNEHDILLALEDKFGRQRIVGLRFLV